MKSLCSRAALCCLFVLLSSWAFGFVGSGRAQSPASPTTISAANTNGASQTPTLNSFVYIDVPSSGSQVVSICIPSGTWVGTLQASMSMGSSQRG